MSYQSFYVDLSLCEDGRLKATWLDPSVRDDQRRTDKFISGQPLLLDDGWNLPGLAELPYRFLWSRRGDANPTDIDTRGETNATDLIGLLLFEMVLPGSDAQRDWIGRFASARSTQGGVRLRLNLAPNLEQLPWELLRAGARWAYVDEKGFLALDDRFSIVRSGKPVGEDVPRPADAGVVADGQQPLRLLIVDAGRSSLWKKPPEGPQDKADYPSLTSEAQTAVDRLELKDPSLVAAALDHRTVAAWEVEGELRSGSGANVFHFTGHGERGDQRSEGPPWLILAANKPEGEAQAVIAARLAADRLGDDLREAKIELAVLAACHAGTGAWWSGFGASLLAKGVPAIVSMQALLEDRAGDIFCSELYGRLADGADLDSAVSAARRRVFIESGCKDWWLPLLHTQREEPLRFRPTARRVAPALAHRSHNDQPEIPAGEEEWLLRPGTWERPGVLSPDGNLWALATGAGLRLRTADGRVNVLVPFDPDSHPIAVSPINEGYVRVLMTSATTTDCLIDLSLSSSSEVTRVGHPAQCAAWIEDRFVWSDCLGEMHGAGELPIPGCTHISNAAGPEGTLTAWIDTASTMTLHRRTSEGVELIPTVRPSDVLSVSELVVAPASVMPERVWIREGLMWRGWTWKQLVEGAA